MAGIDGHMNSQGTTDDIGKGQRGRVANLDHFEPTMIDPEPLARLRAGLGPQLTSDLLRRTREDLAYLLAAAAEARSRGEMETLNHVSRRIEVLAMQMGMPDLRRAAANVASCASKGDIAAQAATFARLARLSAGAIEQLGEVKVSVL